MGVILNISNINSMINLKWWLKADKSSGQARSKGLINVGLVCACACVCVRAHVHSYMHMCVRAHV